ncbi:MAG: hypothetical protein V1696_03590 [Candidatus Jorgensenbacteria bacterium]
MSAADDIFTILFGGYSASYKRLRQALYAPTSPREQRSHASPKTLYTTLSRLKKNGLVAREGGLWKITEKGKRYFEKKKEAFFPRHAPYKEIKRHAPQSMIVAFDIPEKHRRKRDWLRVELAILGFKPIQKSVWFGSAPLPKRFIESLDELDILQFVKFFKAEEKEIV